MNFKLCEIYRKGQTCFILDTQASESTNCTLLFDCGLHTDYMCKCRCIDREYDLPMSSKKCKYIGARELMEHNCTKTRRNIISQSKFALPPRHDKNTSNTVKEWTDLLPNWGLQNSSTTSDMDFFASNMLLEETLVTNSMPNNRDNVTIETYLRGILFSYRANSYTQQTENYIVRTVYDNPPLPIWILAMLACIGVIILITVTLILYD